MPAAGLVLLVIGIWLLIRAVRGGLGQQLAGGFTG